MSFRGTLLSRELDDQEEEQFRQWARDNFLPSKDPEPGWHDVVVDEWNKLKEKVA